MAHPLLQARYDRLQVSAHRTAGRAAIPDWIIKNTRHPADPTKPWSFLHHEYQLGILRSEAEYTSVVKAAQTGMSETSIRLTLALASLYQSSNFMYILPSLLFARRFATTRVDPVIEFSPQLSRELSKDVDSSELKRIANSFVYFAGAQTARQSISVPAKGLILDELDFCSQSVLTSFYSRLGHNLAGESIVTRFSTPTLPGYGISKLHQQGSQGVYMVYHTGCGQWVVVDPLTDIVLPGWEEDNLVNFSRQELDNPTLRPDEAYVACPRCKKRVTMENLVDPGKRAWVHKQPDNDHKSFYVSPLDVPAVNTPAKILRGVSNYERRADWINFGLGKAFQDAENSVVLDAVEKAAVVQAVFPGKQGIVGAVLGSDVGKVSHVLIGKRSGEYMDIIWAERVAATGDGEPVTTWKQRMEQYGVWRAVVDAGPDITSPKQLIQQSVHGRAWACYFTRGGKKLDDLDRDDATQVLGASRTRIIDRVVKDLNAGKIRLMAQHAEKALLLKHIQAMKRVSRISDTTGEKTEHWASTTTENHYFFALVYLYIADQLAAGATAMPTLPVNLLIHKARLGSAVKPTLAQYPY